MNRLLERNIANRSADYKRTQPCNGSTIAYASRSYTEWRSSAGVIEVQREPKRRPMFAR